MKTHTLHNKVSMLILTSSQHIENSENKKNLIPKVSLNDQVYGMLFHDCIAEIIADNGLLALFPLVGQEDGEDKGHNLLVRQVHECRREDGLQQLGLESFVKATSDTVLVDDVQQDFHHALVFHVIRSITRFRLHHLQRIRDDG